MPLASPLLAFAIVRLCFAQFYFENPQSVLGGQVANARLALARLLRTVRGPPLVLSDIVTGHELRRQKLDGRSRLLPLRMPTPICTARRAMKNGSCEAEAWICFASGSLSAASISGAPSTAVMMIPPRCC